MCIYVAVVVLIDGELKGGINLTDLQDIECAHEYGLAQILM